MPNETLNNVRRDLRDFARLITDACQQNGAYQEPTSVNVRFSPDGSIRATVTTRATLFIKYDQ